MKEIEKLAIWLVPIALIGALGSTLSNSLFSRLMTSTQSGGIDSLATFGLTVGDTMTLLTWISPIFTALTHIVIAIWLFSVSTRDGNQRVVWAGFGLLFGLLIPVLYYVVKIHVAKETQENVKET